MDYKNVLDRIIYFSTLEYSISVEEVRKLIKDITDLTKILLLDFGYDERKVRALCTKLRDAGRRSPPWKPHSSRVPGRPQDGADGNRRLRWLFEKKHKFYADEITATLVEVKYYLQVLSMNNAPPLPKNTIQDKFLWLCKNYILPGKYLDPIQLVPIDLKESIEDLRNIQSGHLIPLNRGGKHKPDNAFLVLARSNQLQGNLTLEELINLMKNIVQKHRSKQL